jgi:septum formation protein
MTPTVILASGSPRRRNLLSAAGVRFDVVESGVEEVRRENEAPADYAKRLACDKALAVAARDPDALVVGADTIVFCEGELLEKPSSPDEARRMLRKLSGNVHTVITAYAIARGAQILEAEPVLSRVIFRNLDDDEITDYIATGEPFDKAGAYGIQGHAGSFIAHVDTDRDNVMGLPVTKVVAALRRHGYDG